jgi:hypothetical protein
MDNRSRSLERTSALPSADNPTVPSGYTTNFASASVDKVDTTPITAGKEAKKSRIKTGAKPDIPIIIPVTPPMKVRIIDSTRN